MVIVFFIINVSYLLCNNCMPGIALCSLQLYGLVFIIPHFQMRKLEFKELNSCPSTHNQLSSRAGSLALFNLTPNTVFLHTILSCLSEVGVQVYENLESLTAECVDINIYIWTEGHADSVQSPTIKFGTRTHLNSQAIS